MWRKMNATAKVLCTEFLFHSLPLYFSHSLCTCYLPISNDTHRKCRKCSKKKPRLSDSYKNVEYARLTSERASESEERQLTEKWLHKTHCSRMYLIQCILLHIVDLLLRLHYSVRLPKHTLIALCMCAYAAETHNCIEYVLCPKMYQASSYRNENTQSKSKSKLCLSRV